VNTAKINKKSLINTKAIIGLYQDEIMILYVTKRQIRK